MIWAMVLLASCTCAPRDPWDDPEYVKRLDLQQIAIEDLEAHYVQIGQIHGCTVSGRFYHEPRAKAVELILNEIRDAENTSSCAARTTQTLYTVCDHLCSTDPDPGGFAPCDEAALATLPEGCRWIGWEEVFRDGKKIDSGPRWLDRPFPWQPGSPWDGRHPPEVAQHYADEADVQAILRAHAAAPTAP